MGRGLRLQVMASAHHGADLGSHVHWEGRVVPEELCGFRGPLKP